MLGCLTNPWIVVSKASRSACQKLADGSFPDLTRLAKVALGPPRPLPFAEGFAFAFGLPRLLALAFALGVRPPFVLVVDLPFFPLVSLLPLPLPFPFLFGAAFFRLDGTGDPNPSESLEGVPEAAGLFIDRRQLFRMSSCVRRLTPVGTSKERKTSGRSGVGRFGGSGYLGSL